MDKFRVHPHKYVHIGFKDGVPRESFAYPLSTPRIFDHGFGPLVGSPFAGWSKPPHNVYAMWKYAQAGLAEPSGVFEQASGVIGSTPSDSYLQAFPHVHNAYIAGYVGYVELAKMAGRPYTSQEKELNRLLQLPELGRSGGTCRPIPVTGRVINTSIPSLLPGISCIWSRNWPITCVKMPFRRSKTLLIIIPAWRLIGWSGTTKKCSTKTGSLRCTKPTLCSRPRPRFFKRHTRN